MAAHRIRQSNHKLHHIDPQGGCGTVYRFCNQISPHSFLRLSVDSAMIADPVAADRMSVPWWSLANVLSLDAVAIGWMWHWVFTCEFCRRYPTLPESGIIVLSIWLVYTAERLFDSLRLDRGRPHTLRHRIHFEFRNAFVFAWIAALTIDLVLILRYATEAQLRWGYVAIAIVLAYVAGVHAARPVRRWIPKELQAGMVFAFGVSLSSWSESNVADMMVLLLSTLMAGVLFAANCLSVACWERECDSSQGFGSWVTQYPNRPSWLPSALICHLLVSASMWVTHALPPLITTCLVFSDLLLLVVLVASAGRESSVRASWMAVASASPFGVVADAALVIPPTVWLVLGSTLQ